MYDGRKIIPGLILFLGLVTYPLWHNHGEREIELRPQTKAPS